MSVSHVIILIDGETDVDDNMILNVIVDGQSMYWYAQNNERTRSEITGESVIYW